MDEALILRAFHEAITTHSTPAAEPPTTFEGSYGTYLPLLQAGSHGTAGGAGSAATAYRTLSASSGVEEDGYGSGSVSGRHVLDVAILRQQITVNEDGYDEYEAALMAAEVDTDDGDGAGEGEGEGAAEDEDGDWDHEPEEGQEEEAEDGGDRRHRSSRQQRLGNTSSGQATLTPRAAASGISLEAVATAAAVAAATAVTSMLRDVLPSTTDITGEGGGGVIQQLTHTLQQTLAASGLMKHGYGGSSAAAAAVSPSYYSPAAAAPRDSSRSQQPSRKRRKTEEASTQDSSFIGPVQRPQMLWSCCPRCSQPFTSHADAVAFAATRVAGIPSCRACASGTSNGASARGATSTEADAHATGSQQAVRWAVDNSGALWCAAGSAL